MAAAGRVMQDDCFLDSQGAPRVVRGISVYTGATKLAELAGRIGFETVWIEMEHGPTDFALAEALCQSIEASGGFGTIRVSDSQRCHILRALEAGARIVVIPMVNTAQQAADAVRFGKFPPLGERGFNTRSRGVAYGLDGPAPVLFERANERTHLIAQIETREAVANLDAILAVEGISGILIGPGDLSASLGCCGNLRDPELIRVATDCIRRARAAGLHAGILVSPGPLLDAALAAGCDLVFAGGDITNLIEPWKQVLAGLPSAGRVA